MQIENIKDFLDEKFDKYNNPSFIESDPIQIPHRFTKAEDIEIAGFLASTIAWGKRTMIIRNANKIMEFMQNEPHEFILNSNFKDFEKAEKIGHRTFMTEDFIFFLKSLQNIYRNYGGLKSVFENGYLEDKTVFSAIKNFRNVFFELEHEKRAEKHVANVMKKSAAKRINMFLMWMVRNDSRGVHFGLWDKISASKLMMPLDVHSGNTARDLSLLLRKQNDWQAVAELTKNLSEFDANDPVKYDFALFGLGVFDQFSKKQ